jgi:hypothetical protein
LAASQYGKIRGGFTSWSGKGKNATKSGMVLPWNARKNDAPDSHEKTNVRGMEWTDFNGSSGRYTGEVNNDRLPHGRGIMKYSYGLIAEGEFNNGVLNEGPQDRIISAAASMSAGGAGGMSVGPMSVGPMSIGPMSFGPMSVHGGSVMMHSHQQQGGMPSMQMPLAMSMPMMQAPPPHHMQYNPMMGGAPNTAAQLAHGTQQNTMSRNMNYGGGGPPPPGMGGPMPMQHPMQMPMHPMQMQQYQMPNHHPPPGVSAPPPPPSHKPPVLEINISK